MTDYALTRPRTRATTHIIDAQSVGLLEEFRSPTTIVSAILNYSERINTDPEQILEHAFPLLTKLLHKKFLVPAHSPDANGLETTWSNGERASGFVVEDCLQIYEDSEVYKVILDNGVPAVVKILRINAGATAHQMFEREAAVLKQLDGTINPTLLTYDLYKERPYLGSPGFPGVSPTSSSSIVVQIEASIAFQVKRDALEQMLVIRDA
ncbi:hypothetical protein HC891_17580, partial [Candidatus Gracilibacteria bacterium]|nr:hypothetical protein [Candidatus Gracilibacteria bacterium]